MVSVGLELCSTGYRCWQLLGLSYTHTQHNDRLKLTVNDICKLKKRQRTLIITLEEAFPSSSITVVI